MDLTKEFPRSPYDMLAGLVMLPRTADKARALQAGALGDYIYNCPLDQMLFGFLGIGPEDFAAAIAQAADDEALAAWIERRCPRQAHEKEAFNNSMRHKRPEGGEGQQWLEEQRRKLGRDDLHTFFEVLDADEGRF